MPCVDSAGYSRRAVVDAGAAPTLCAGAGSDYRGRQRGQRHCDRDALGIALLVRKGKYKLDLSLSQYLSEVEKRFVTLAQDVRVAYQGVLLSDAFPKDPADRLIAATALVTAFCFSPRMKPSARPARCPASGSTLTSLAERSLTEHGDPCGNSPSCGRSGVG